MRLLEFRLCTAVAAMTCACGSAPRTPTSLPPAVHDTSLGPGDIFDIRVYDEEGLTGTFRVGEDGTIDYPFLGRLHVSGQRPAEVADVIRTGLREGQYLVNPQVSILVKEYSSKRISVFGAVQRPGTFPYLDQMDIVHAVTLAGGFTALADQNETTVTRAVEGRERRVRVPVEAIGEGRATNFQVQPGDIIFVPERVF